MDIMGVLTNFSPQNYLSQEQVVSDWKSVQNSKQSFKGYFSQHHLQKMVLTEATL